MSSYPSRLPEAACRACAALAAALMLMLCGCRCPRAVHTYEYLTDYDRMSDGCEPLASLVYMAPQADLASYKTLIINEFGVGESWVANDEQATAYAMQIRALLSKQLRNRRVFETVLLDPAQAEQAPGPALRMDGRVTVFDLGSGWQRYMSFWAPFLSHTGATDFQIEARFVDARTGQTVLELADRRRHMGNTPWGPNYRTFDGQFVMRHTVQLTAHSLAELLNRARADLLTIHPQKEGAAHAVDGVCLLE
jgi:hypothetical protein